MCLCYSRNLIYNTVNYIYNLFLYAEYPLFVDFKIISILLYEVLLFSFNSYFYQTTNTR